MKVVTVDTMQSIDRRAIEAEGVPGLTLMENAGRACVDEIITMCGVTGHVVIVAGKGNNGGDGFVIARLLLQKGWKVTVLILAEHDQIRGDAARNLEKLPAVITFFCSCEGQLQNQHKEEIFQADVIVDALLGTGLNSSTEGIYREGIELINASGTPVIAVDIPSGVNGTSGQVLGNAVRAHTTVTFAFAKLGHVLFPGAEYTGRLVIADIGIPPNLMEQAAGYEYVTDKLIRPLLQRRVRLSHKGTYGNCLIVAGSAGKTGAATLTANSTVRTGSGLVTVAVAEKIHSIIELKTTEAMSVALPDAGNGYLSENSFPAIEKLLTGRDAVALGPGLDRHPGTYALVRALIETVSIPLVVDADGLNAIADDVSVLRRKKSNNVILTPHPGEMARLLGVSVQEVEAFRFEVAREFSRTNDVYLVLKGARTIMASPDGRIAINSSGNPGMATGGMGDVLTGIITSLLGQGYSSWDACRIGVFIHGHAADLVAGDKGEIGMNASDVQEKLPYAFNELLNSSPPKAAMLRES